MSDYVSTRDPGEGLEKRSSGGFITVEKDIDAVKAVLRARMTR